MLVSTLSQPEDQLGLKVDELLGHGSVYSKVVFVSAFVALRTILRLRERLLAQMGAGATLRFTIGIDLGGTSREVLEELLRWNCEAWVFHNAIPRSTFHPKVYLFEGPANATLFVGSNNLTDGGFYTNYEAASRVDFAFPEDAASYSQVLVPLAPFLEPQGGTSKKIDRALIDVLVARGQLPSEAEARQVRRSLASGRRLDLIPLPASPFAAVGIPMAPLLPDALRRQEPDEGPPPPESNDVEPELLPTVPVAPTLGPGLVQGAGVLVWRKTLPRTDALQVREGTNHVGGVRLTQAGFEYPPGQRIDQRTYFRQVFAGSKWEPEPGGHQDQEHTFVPMRIVIRGRDLGVRNIELSHKPSGEAGQDNYTTILRWGHELIPLVIQENLTGAVFSIYESTDADIGFLIEITDD